MATITNYYEELGLNPEMTIEEIGSKLDQLENVWNQRMFIEPEKANTTMALINEARSKFASEDTKAEYDSSLQNKIDETGSKGTSFETIRDMMKKAMGFADKDQWDLAKISIDKVIAALSSADITEEQEAAVYRYAGEVYTNNGIFAQAIDFENRAIALLPDSVDGYITKSQTLDALISSNDQDVSKEIETMKKTCESWIEISRAQQDTEWVALGLETLAKAYLWALDYPSAYKYATEAISTDPEKKAGEGILNFLNQTSWPKLDEFSLYYNEKSPFEEDIKKIISDLVSAGLIPKEGMTITQKRLHNAEENDYYEEEQNILSTFILNPDGTFVEKRENREDWFNKKNYSDNKSESDTKIQPTDLHTIMYETDFKAYYELRTTNGDKSYFEWTDVVSRIHNRYQKVQLTRFNRIKGKMIYDKLKEIVDQAAEQIEKQKKYNEECSKINAAYNAELEPLKQKNSDEFASKREALQREKGEAIEKAKGQEAQRQQIQNQINAMKSELSSLGFFAGKKKKEIQANIENLERSLSGLTTVENTTGLYNKKAEELDLQERNALAQLEKDLRAKYPLPSQP